MCGLSDGRVDSVRAAGSGRGSFRTCNLTDREQASAEAPAGGPRPVGAGSTARAATARCPMPEIEKWSRAPASNRLPC